MMVQKGDYILLEYTVTSKDDGKVVETTVEDTAKQANIYNPDEVYGPRLIIVGGRRNYSSPPWSKPSWRPMRAARSTSRSRPTRRSVSVIRER